MKIGILGLTFNSENMGCEALSYGFMQLLDEIAKQRKEQLEVYIFIQSSTKGLLKQLVPSCFRVIYLPKINYSNLRFKIAPINTGTFGFVMDEYIKSCNIIFDFTAGDSFTDIYGKDRFFTRTTLKQRVIDLGVPLVLGNQTFGPFNNDDVKTLARKVILGSYEVIARDEQSFHCVKDLTGRDPILSTDVAFFLPYKRKNIESDKILVGINPSGLLWCGGYNGENQFELSVDYQNYCVGLIRKLIDSRKYDIYLIAHVAAPTNSTEIAVGHNADNDLIACNALHKMFPDTKVVDIFDSAISAKSFISGMDAFIGARMHATIAAYSSGVPVIPFSYSRKFEGLYDFLEYPYVISGRQLKTDEAIVKTIKYLEEQELMKKAINDFKPRLDSLLHELKDHIEGLLVSVAEE